MNVVAQIKEVTNTLVARGGFEIKNQPEDYQLRPLHNNMSGVLLQHPETKVYCSVNARRICAYRKDETTSRVQLVAESILKAPKSVYAALGFAEVSHA